MKKQIIGIDEDDDLDVATSPSADTFRRPLKNGESLPTIPSMVEQALLAGATATRTGKRASS